MLVIRMQRVGRHGHAQFRVVVQDSRRTPTSGKVVARIGSYDPHTKNVILDKEKAEHYLGHGAQPSPRVVRLLVSEGVKLPKWVSKPPKQQAKIKNPDKLRRNRPPEETPAQAKDEVSVEAKPEVAEEAEVNLENEAAAKTPSADRAVKENLAEQTGEESNELASEEAEAAAETADDDSAASEQNQ